MLKILVLAMLLIFFSGTKKMETSNYTNHFLAGKDCAQIICGKFGNFISIEICISRCMYPELKIRNHKY
jgi:hypothetical protein